MSLIYKIKKIMLSNFSKLLPNLNSYKKNFLTKNTLLNFFKLRLLESEYK